MAADDSNRFTMGANAADSIPDSLRPCRYFPSGTCRFSNRCKFLHEELEQLQPSGTTATEEEVSLSTPPIKPDSILITQLQEISAELDKLVLANKQAKK
jgi:hypothetical protein